MNVRKKLKWQIDDSWDKVRQLVRLCLCVSQDPQRCTRCTDTFDSHLDYLTHTCRPAALYQCSMCGHLYFNDDDFQSHECTCLPAFRKETSGQLVKRKENGQLRQSVKRKEDGQHGQSVKRKEDGQHSQSVKRKEDGHFGQFVRRRESGTGQRRHVAQQSEISDSDQQIITTPTLNNSEEKRKQLKRRLAVSDQDSGELLCPPEKELRTTSSSLTPSSQQMVSLLKPQIGAKMQEGKRGVLIVDVFTPKNDPTKGRKCTIIQHTVESLNQSDLGVSQKQQVSVEAQDQNPPVVPVTQPTLVLELVAVKPGSGNPPNQHPSVTSNSEHVPDDPKTQHSSVISTNRHVPDDPKTQPSSVTSISQHDPAIHTIQHVPVYSQSHHIPVISKNQESSDHSTIHQTSVPSPMCHASFDPQRQQDRIGSIIQLSPDVSQSQHASFNSISEDGVGEATESESEIKYSVTLREVEENHGTQQIISHHHTSLSQNEDVCTHDNGAEFLFIKSEQESSPENTLYIDYAEVEGVVMDTVDQQITMEDSTVMPGQHMEDSTAVPGRHMEDSTAVPGRHIEDSMAVPGRHMEDSTAVPGRHMEDSTAVPGRNMEDSTEKSEDSVNSTMEPGQYPEDANDSTVKSEDVDDSVIERDMENGATEPGVEISTVEPEDVDDSMTEPYVDDSATESGVDDEMEGDVNDEIEPDVDDSVTESGVDDEMEGDVDDSATEPGVDNEIEPDVDDSATEPDVNVSAREPDVDGSAREPNVEENLTEPNVEEITEQVERDVAEMATHKDSLVSRCSEKVDEKEKTGDGLAGSRLGVEGCSSHGRLRRQIPSILPELETWESTRAREDITQENIYLVRGHSLRNRKKKPPTEAKQPSLQKDEGLNYTLDDFRSHFRISRPTFEWTCKKIAPYLRHLPDSIYLCIPLEKQLLVTLWYLVTQDSTTAIMSRFNISSTVFTECYAKMLNVLVNHLKKEIILHPAEHEHQVIMDSFMQKQCFPNVLGVIGVSHVRIRNRTSDIPDTYVNSSGFYSLILQAICREDLRFIDCAVGCPGSYSNADVLKKSSIWQNGQTLCGNGHFLGNEAYPLTTWLLTPYHDSGGLTPQQQGYNKRLSGTQETIKRAFGCLKGRFNRLCFKNNIGLSKTPGDILACCILHNICVMNDEDVEEFYEDDSGDVEVPPCDLADIHSDGQIKRDNIARSLPH